MSLTIEPSVIVVIVVALIIMGLIWLSLECKIVEPKNGKKL